MSTHAFRPLCKNFQVCHLSCDSPSYIPPKPPLQQVQISVSRWHENKTAGEPVFLPFLRRLIPTCWLGVHWPQQPCTPLRSRVQCWPLSKAFQPVKCPQILLKSILTCKRTLKRQLCMAFCEVPIRLYYFWNLEARATSEPSDTSSQAQLTISNGFGYVEPYEVTEIWLLTKENSFLWFNLTSASE